MNKRAFFSLMLLVMFLGVSPVSALTPVETVFVEDLHAPVDDPYVIEGFDVSNVDGDGIVLINCSNVVIRGNRVHDSNYDAGEIEHIPVDWNAPGRAVYIENSVNITVVNNTLDHNLIGFKAFNSSGIRVSGNNVSFHVYHSAIMLMETDDSVVSGNLVEDNGIPGKFDLSGGAQRIIGIQVIRGDNVEIHHNTVRRSTSDGISAYGQNYFTEDVDSIWRGLASNISIHHNLIEDNMESGIWAVRARALQIYGNTIIMPGPDSGTGGGPLVFEFDVDDSEIYNNTIVSGRYPGWMTYAYSHGNYYHDNIIYTLGPDEATFCSDEQVSTLLTPRSGVYMWEASGIPETPSSGNIDEENIVLYPGMPVEVPDPEPDEEVSSPEESEETEPEPGEEESSSFEPEKPDEDTKEPKTEEKSDYGLLPATVLVAVVVSIVFLYRALRK